MPRDIVLSRGRAAAEAGMVDTCTITRYGTATTDEFSGEVEETRTTVYSGRCRFQQQTGGTSSKETDSGQAYVLLQRVEVQFPVSAINIDVDDLITCLTSRDPNLVGRIFLVRDLAYKTDATSRRIQVEEQTSS